VIFDELFSSYKIERAVIQELRKAMGRKIVTLDANARCNTRVHDTFNSIFESEQFARMKNIDISTSGNKPLGLVIEINLPTNQGYISDVVPNFLASHIKNWRTELIGSFMTRVNDDLVFTANEINTAIEAAMENNTFTITCSTDIISPPSHAKGTIDILQIQLDQINTHLWPYTLKMANDTHNQASPAGIRLHSSNTLLREQQSAQDSTTHIWWLSSLIVEQQACIGQINSNVG